MIHNKTKDNIFIKYYNNNTFLLSPFIREFKKELNEDKLYYIENAYSILDINENNKGLIDGIKKYYDSKNHPDFISGKKNEEE